MRIQRRILLHLLQLRLERVRHLIGLRGVRLRVVLVLAGGKHLLSVLVLVLAVDVSLGESAGTSTNKSAGWVGGVCVDVGVGVEAVERGSGGGGGARVGSRGGIGSGA